jgi:hypothetical protein
MKITDLGFLTHQYLPTSSSLFRIQWARARRSTVVRGALKLPPPGTGGGRFDLQREAVAYFAEVPETAAYETLARRETTLLSLGSLAQRRLLTLHTTATLHLADLRPHVSSFPVLHSLRYSETRELAEDIAAQGYEGIVFASAQHPGMDCYAIFEKALGLLKPASRAVPLATSAGDVHSCVVAAIRGSRVPVVLS